MDTVETTGKTIEEARAAALQQLQATEDEVEFEVIEEPRKLLGFLGTQGDYHLRATRKSAMATGEAPVETVSEEQPVAEVGAPQVQPINDLASTGAGAVEQVVAQRAIEFLAETTRLMGLHTDVVVVNSEPGEIELEIRGEGLGLLIGRHGATLDALQMLAAVVGNTGLSQGARVVVDAEQYRERRREMLRKMALQQAEKAKESQQEVVIPDLKAFERRIVHLTLKDDPDVETYSEGEGDDRCIVISPRNV
ncbi:MAG: RNA-binding cell elongation regulator Jag/EloR [Armatimonadia bacterium]